MLTDEQLYAWWCLRHLKGVGNIAINELLSRLLIFTVQIF